MIAAAFVRAVLFVTAIVERENARRRDRRIVARRGASGLDGRVVSMQVTKVPK